MSSIQDLRKMISKREFPDPNEFLHHLRLIELIDDSELDDLMEQTTKNVWHRKYSFLKVCEKKSEVEVQRLMEALKKECDFENANVIDHPGPSNEIDRPLPSNQNKSTKTDLGSSLSMHDRGITETEKLLTVDEGFHVRLYDWNDSPCGGRLIDTGLHIEDGDILLSSFAFDNDSKRLYMTSDWRSIIHCYDFKAGCAVEIPELPRKLDAYTLLSTKDGLYVTGGRFEEPDGSYSLVKDCYRLVGNEWVRLPNMNEGRYNHRVVELEGKLYSIAGSNDVSTSDTPELGLECSLCGSTDNVFREMVSVDCYEPLNNEWKLQQNCLNSTMQSDDAVIYHDQLYLLYGEKPIIDVYQFDESFNRTSIKYLKRYKTDFKPFSIISLVKINNRLYGIGREGELCVKMESNDSWKKLNYVLPGIVNYERPSLPTRKMCLYFARKITL